MFAAAASTALRQNIGTTRAWTSGGSAVGLRVAARVVEVALDRAARTPARRRVERARRSTCSIVASSRRRRIASGSRSSWVKTTIWRVRAARCRTRASPSTLAGSIACTGSSITANRNGDSSSAARGRKTLTDSASSSPCDITPSAFAPVAVGAHVEVRPPAAADLLERDLVQVHARALPQLAPVRDRALGDRREALRAQLLGRALDPLLGVLERLQRGRALLDLARARRATRRPGSRAPARRRRGARARRRRGRRARAASRAAARTASGPGAASRGGAGGGGERAPVRGLGGGRRGPSAGASRPGARAPARRSARASSRASTRRARGRELALGARQRRRLLAQRGGLLGRARRPRVVEHARRAADRAVLAVADRERAAQQRGDVGRARARRSCAASACARSATRSACERLADLVVGRHARARRAAAAARCPRRTRARRAAARRARRGRACGRRARRRPARRARRRGRAARPARPCAAATALRWLS